MCQLKSVCFRLYSSLVRLHGCTGRYCYVGVGVGIGVGVGCGRLRHTVTCFSIGTPKNN